MKLRGASLLRRFWRRLRRTLMPQRGAVILCYHRIVDLPNSPRKLWVSPQRFAEQMECLTRYYTPIRLSELLTALKEGKVPDRAVVVTFDDGYADNLRNAKPILERYGVPATLFVTTGFVGTKKEFYWDELERLLLQGTAVQEVFIEVNGQKRFWKLSTSEERLRAYHEICDYLTSLPNSKREVVLTQLRDRLGANDGGCESNRVMNVDELIEISKSNLIEIGAHTVTHPDLSTLSPELQWQEIATGKQQLEMWLNSFVRWFAYPYGRGNNMTKKLVQKAGFEAACAMVHKTVTEKSDPFWLPRFFVENWDGETFLQRLREV